MATNYQSLGDIDRGLLGRDSGYGKQPEIECCWSCGATKFQNRYHDKGCRWCVGTGGGIPRSIFDTDKDRRAVAAIKRACNRIGIMRRTGSYDSLKVSEILKEEFSK